jgi:hypothetical protein
MSATLLYRLSLFVLCVFPPPEADLVSIGDLDLVSILDLVSTGSWSL